MPTWVDKLRSEHDLPEEGYRQLLTTTDETLKEELFTAAREVAVNNFGKKVFIRGLIEVSNFCKNNCLYCGIRRGNREVPRYRLSKDDILASCAEGYRVGIRTFVMQGGEDPRQTTPWLVDVIAEMRSLYPDCAITLSLGEKTEDEYRLLYEAGANRYLLRHETFDEEHYAGLHPADMSGAYRKECLAMLKRIGFQTGTGVMVGSPGQTIEHLIKDLQFIRRLSPQMVGIGPFLPHHATPFANEAKGSADTTLRMLAICRLMLPQGLIPSTTALATLGGPEGRLQGILCGANVVMPNLSPPKHRTSYELYDNKAHSHSESAEGLRLLNEQLKTIGYAISLERGDHPNFAR